MRAPEAGLCDEPRAAGHRTVQRPHHARKVRASSSKHWIDVADIDVAFICGPEDMMHERLGSAPGTRHGQGKHQGSSCSRPASPSTARAARARSRARAGMRSHRDHRRQPSPASRWRRTKNRCSTPASRKASTCAIRARAASARPAAARCVDGKVEMDVNYRARRLRDRARLRAELPELPGDRQRGRRLRPARITLRSRRSHELRNHPVHDREGGIARLTLNRPDRLNSFTRPCTRSARRAGRTAGRQDRCGCWCSPAPAAASAPARTWATAPSARARPVSTWASRSRSSTRRWYWPAQPADARDLRRQRRGRRRRRQPGAGLRHRDRRPIGQLHRSRSASSA